MIEELEELANDLRAIDAEAAQDAAELLAALNAILPPTLNKRRCHSCGRVAYHADSVAPYVCCHACKSRDTRLIKPRQAMQNQWFNAPRRGMEAACEQLDAAIAAAEGSDDGN